MTRQRTRHRYPPKPRIQYSWLRDAKCRTMNPAAFDTTPRQAPQGDEIAKAARLCEGCPVAKECALEVVTQPKPTYGVIRAGVPLTALYDYRRGWQALALAAIANDGDIADALTRYVPARHLDALGAVL